MSPAAAAPKMLKICGFLVQPRLLSSTSVCRDWWNMPAGNLQRCFWQQTNPTLCDGLLIRSFASTSQREAAGKGPVSFRSLMITILLGAGLVTGARQYEKQRMQTIMNKTQEVVGKAAIGGPFSLTDHNGKPFTHQDLLGEFSIMYFGFTHCPDICPDELEKLAAATDIVQKQTGAAILPVFITVDPARDGVEQVRNYVKEFHPRMVGLTGDEDSIRATSKAFRVYYHKTSEDTTDYLVDHSIIMYLLDPSGEFVTFYGKNFTVDQLAESMAEHVSNWKAGHPEYHSSPKHI